MLFNPIMKLSGKSFSGAQSLWKKCPSCKPLLLLLFVLDLSQFVLSFTILSLSLTLFLTLTELRWKEDGNLHPLFSNNAFGKLWECLIGYVLRLRDFNGHYKWAGLIFC